MQIAGVLNLNASGRGTLKDPQLTANVAIPTLTRSEPDYQQHFVPD